jgi:Domain of unknown function (DUF4112)
MQYPLTPPHDEMPRHALADREGGLPRDVAIAMWIADWVDDRFIDPVVGLILPGAGDLLFAAVGMYPVFVAVRRRMPAIVAARMIRNVAIDLLFGAIPVVGDVFDFVFKSHRRNADLLLERHVLGPSPWRDWAAVLGALLALLVALAVPIGLVALALARFG